MKRQPARSPFQLEDLQVGEPRPVYRPLKFVSPFSLSDADRHLRPAPAAQHGRAQSVQRNSNASQSIDACLCPAALSEVRKPGCQGIYLG